jgi:hypothetical protein
MSTKLQPELKSDHRQQRTIEDALRDGEALFQAGVERAIADHKALGTAVYFAEEEAPADVLIKQLPDGRRLKVQVSKIDGSETVIEELPAS